MKKSYLRIKENHIKTILIMGILIIGTLVLGLYFLQYDNQSITGSVISDINETEEDIIFIEPNTLVDLTKPRWDHMPLTYHLVNEYDCGSNEAKRIRKAFSIIQEQSEEAVTFVENDNEWDIEIECIRDFILEPGVLVSGEALPIITGNAITGGYLTFYNTLPNSNRVSSTCYSVPDTEMHEILHILGFEHKTEYADRFHIMHKLSRFCNKNLNQDVLDELKNIYSPQNDGI